MKYRPEIDGLRAVAVLPVILFHAGFAFCSGGFVGVDIFFAISGYLITTIILSELERGEFSLIRFYERRARRILPALFCVMACCVPFAWWSMLPSQYRDFSQSLIAVALFVSNILFWRQDDYFALAADEKPLLHTWSLAVEEQYYMLFPLALMLLWWLGRKRIFLFIALLAVASLLFSEWSTRHAPSANFYLAPTRAWELFAGSLCAFILRDGQPLKRGPWSDLAALAGLGLIAFAIVMYDGSTPIPSLYALAPVGGACLFILFGHAGTLAARLLTLRPLVGIGLISYSAYLWHHPLFAFGRLFSGKPLGDFQLIGLTLAALALAYCSWRFIEKPFRNRAMITFPRVAFTAVSFAAFFTVLGIAGQVTAGFKTFYLTNRLNAAENRVYQKFQKDSPPRGFYKPFDDGKCRFSVIAPDEAFEARFRQCQQQYGKAWLVIGDSHAINMFNIFAKAHLRPFLVGLVQGGCRPYHQLPKCQYRAFDSFVDRNAGGLDLVIFHQSGSHLMLDEDGKEDSWKAFTADAEFIAADRNIEKISDYLDVIGTKVRTVWLGPFIEARVNFTDARLIKAAALHPISINPTSLSHFAALETVLKAYNQQHEKHFQYRSLFDVLQISSDFLVTGGCTTYRDGDHFSACGEDIVAAKIKRAVANGLLN